jgi:cob(I)alamin adenosyltransferase
MTKIYTKKGDKGMTSIATGKRVSKDFLRICAYGDVDELNAALGVCRHSCDNDKYLNGILRNLQRDLFRLGADLAMPSGVKVGGRRIAAADTKKLEKKIDEISARLKPLQNFILPGGCEAAAFFHLARTVCRRAERTVASLQKQEKINPETIRYLNRFGDLLFVMARYANFRNGVREEKWERGS